MCSCFMFFSMNYLYNSRFWSQQILHTNNIKQKIYKIKIMSGVFFQKRLNQANSICQNACIDVGLHIIFYEQFFIDFYFGFYLSVIPVDLVYLDYRYRYNKILRIILLFWLYIHIPYQERKHYLTLVPRANRPIFCKDFFT